MYDYNELKVRKESMKICLLEFWKKSHKIWKSRIFRKVNDFTYLMIFNDLI